MRIFAIAVIAAALSGAAHAETFVSDIADREVYLEVPNGHCVLDGANENEATVLEYLETANAGVNYLLIAFANCRQLQAWKQGSRATLDSFGYILTPASTAEIPGGQGEVNSEMDKVFSQLPIAQLGQVLSQATGRAQAALDDLQTGVQIQQMTPLGYFGFDSYGSYVGIMQKIKTAQGREKTMIGIYSMIAVNERLVFYYLWDAYSGNVAEVNSLLGLTKKHSRAQHSVN